MPALRALIDAIDRDTLQLFARRMALVSEIAALKREGGVPIRDLERERQVLSERRDRAAELGLPTGVIESIYRLLLVASRDMQASMRTALPADQRTETVAVIGGKGGMGRSMCRLFSDLGHAVLVSDVDTELSLEEAVRAASVVVVSVPIEHTEEVIRQVGPSLSPEGLLMDVTSVKTAPMAQMLESTPASVVGTHPLFGPGVHTLTGQRVVLCKGRGDAWFDWVYKTFRARGMLVTTASPEKHDRAMGVVQVLTHYQTQVLGLALSKMNVDIDETLLFTSPSYLLELYVCARHFAQSSALYGSIEMTNPRLGEVTGSFQDAAREVADVLAAGDDEKFAAIFDDVRQTFGAFTEEALEQSSFLIDRLVELTSGEALRMGTVSEAEAGSLEGDS